MHYQSDYILRLIEQMGGLIRRALERFRQNGEPGEPIEMIHEAIGLAIDLDPRMFLRLDPPSMVSLLELGNVDDREIEMLAEAIEAEASIMEESGDIVAAQGRREQATAIRTIVGPLHGN